MAGGIQPGMVATDAQALALDRAGKNAVEIILNRLASQFPTLRHQRKLTQEQIPGGIGACEPDAGCWFDGDKLIAVGECKKQGERGNAIERWFKNHFIVRSINPQATYVTFASGEGVIAGNPIHKCLHVAHSGEFGVINETAIGLNNLHCRVDGFTADEVADEMVAVITAYFEQ